jgi:predicted AlkP superfamily phosphohydrolase/phosphomutase
VPWEEGVRGQRTFEKIDWENTTAVANTQGLVYLTLDRDDPEYDSLRSELKAELDSLEIPGGPLAVREMHEHEAIYEGPFLEKAPDLVAHQTDGVHMSEATGTAGVHHDTGRWEAENIPPGIFAAVGPDVTTAGDMGKTKISDIAPTILQLMDCAVPTDMDGEPITITDGDVRNREPIPSPHGDGEAGQNEEVRERLEDLGYLS